MSKPLLEMLGIVKRFPGVKALTDVDLRLNAGEVLALCGENGAGKSTLMKILGGLYPPDAGSIRFEGEPIHFSSPADSKSAGIALIHQELLLVPHLDITANLFLGEEKRWFPLGPMKFVEMRSRAKELLQQVGLNINPNTEVGKLTPGQQQMVEIAKALALDARILVMDEPTSSLTLSESLRLFSIVDALKKAGKSIVYISHRMEEIFRLADRIVVLRDGKNAGELDPKKSSVEAVVAMMVGRARSQWFPNRKIGPRSDIIFKVKNLIVPGSPSGISFDVQRGEILGFAGLVGAGRTELMQVLFGLDAPTSGSMELAGEPYRPRRPADAIKAGVLLAPEDRKQHGLVLAASLQENIALPATVHRLPFLTPRYRKEKATATSAIATLNVRAHSPAQKAATLSGGNQQKVVLAKWLALGPKILILDEPTRGIDVGAKAEIYQRIADLADAGITILLVSSDMEELLGIADRVVVLHERKLSGVVDKKELSEERLMTLMTGVGK